MTIQELVPHLACVEFGASTELAGDRVLRCSRCGVQWTPVDGVFDLRPKVGLPLPRMYQDADYQAWNRQLARAQDYLYRAGPLVRWVQTAGHRAVGAMARASPDALTLDLGCGDGGHWPYLWRPERTIGLDIDLPSLIKLRARYPAALVVRGDCYRLPFAAETFDRVINRYNAEHLVHLDFALEEIGRVLKSGGDLFVSVPAEGGMGWVAGRRLTTARRLNGSTLNYLRANAIDHCNCVWQIEKALARHFRVARHALFPFGVPSYHLNLIVTWRLRK